VCASVGEERSMVFTGPGREQEGDTPDSPQHETPFPLKKKINSIPFFGVTNFSR
jgi:hypothetical protein